MSFLDIFKKNKDEEQASSGLKKGEWGTLLVVSEGSHTIDDNGNVAVNVENVNVQRVLKERFDELEKFDKAITSHHA